jgi:hypothetical protein
MTLFSYWRAMGTASRTARRCVVPRCEVLEDRTLPSITFTVLNLNDSGPGSLRDAVGAANAILGADTIVFAPGLTGTIHLTSGELLITDSLTIKGPGAGRLAVSGKSSDRDSRVFEVAAGTTDSISGLTITGGSGVVYPGLASKNDGFGGGILSFGSLTIYNCLLSDNTAQYDGGGIYNKGALILSRSTLSGNNCSSPSVGLGGGIYNEGSVIVSDSTLSGNFASFLGGGIDNAGTLKLNSSMVSGNSTRWKGGGIFSSGFASTAVNSSTLSNNSATYGGGIYNLGSVILSGSTLSGNFASRDGGGIFNVPATVPNPLGTVTVLDCMLSGNSAGDSGGGIYNLGGTVILSGSTLSGNSASNNGGGIDNEGALTVTNSTVSGNNATKGSDLYEDQSAGATLTVTNSTITDIYVA